MSQDNKIDFEEMFAVVSGQLVTALRGLEQMANLIRAGQLELPKVKTVEIPEPVEAAKPSHIPPWEELPVESPLLETPVTAVTVDPTQAALDRLRSAVEKRGGWAVGTAVSFDVPQPYVAEQKEDLSLKEAHQEISGWTNAEKIVYGRLREAGMSHKEVVDAVKSISSGEAQASIRAQQAHAKAKETLIDTKPYLNYFIGIDGLMKRFVNSNLVPGGRGELSVGQGEICLPFFNAELRDAKPEVLKRYHEGFYRSPKNEDSWSLLLQLENETIVFPEIEKVENPLPYIVVKTGPLADLVQVVSVLPFPLLKDLYEATEQRLLKANGV